MSQAGLQLSVPRMAFAWKSSCLRFLRASITGLHHHAQFMWTLGIKLRAAGELSRPTVAWATSPAPGERFTSDTIPRQSPSTRGRPSPSH